MRCSSVCARLPTFLLLFGLGMACSPFSHASDYGSCPPEMNSRAVSLLIDARGNWSSLFKHQSVFASCDDGELGEGYSDAVANLFAQNWDQFATFVSLAKTHSAFKKWALRHIDATASDETLNRIISNSNTCINNGAEKLCNTVRQSATNDLIESARSQ